jgi:hypothetical protein
MPKTVAKRIRRVDRHIASIDRRLGFLASRAFFNPNGLPDWEEVEIFAFQDLGVTPKNVATGEELSAHRFTIQVSRDWLESHTGLDGIWGISREESGTKAKANPLLVETIVECESESEDYQDKDTYGTVVLRVIQSIFIPGSGVIVIPAP